jgi:hypothetical protein
MMDVISIPYIGELPSSHPEICKKLAVKLSLHLEAGIRVVLFQHLVVGLPQATSKGDSQSPEEERKCKDRREDPAIGCRG